jgi:hypothetical protein
MRDLFEVHGVVNPLSSAGEIFTANAGSKVIIGFGVHVAKIKLQTIDGSHRPIAKILIGRLAKHSGTVVTVRYAVAGHRVIVTVFVEDIGRDMPEAGQFAPVDMQRSPRNGWLMGELSIHRSK